MSIRDSVPAHAGCQVTEDKDMVAILCAHYSIRVAKQGFRYSFADREGGVIAPAHPVSGVRFGLSDKTMEDAEDAVLLPSVQPDAVRFRIKGVYGSEADITITTSDYYAKFEIIPRQNGKYTIEARTASMAPVYGLGDYGSQIDTVPTEEPPARGKLDVPARDSANLLGFVRRDMVNQGTNMRFISNFTIFPAQGFAQVLFEEGSKRISITEEENGLGANNVPGIRSLYYFTGDVRRIYADYKRAREREGYADKKPKYGMFRLGWEAYGALAWNTYQSAVEETIREYIERGYKLEWAVIGSAFWKGDRTDNRQGATTSFNIWDDKEEPGRQDGLPNPRFPDPEGLKRFFRDNGIRLLFGLRNHFKAEEGEGGYHHPLNNGAFLQEARDSGYLLEDSQGKPVLITNAQFPKGNLYVLDGGNPEAVNWFAALAETWGVDGFKEDAMIYTKHYRDGNWNALNAALMDRGCSVIVRNSAYSVPGDLIRINDTYYGKGEGFHFDQDRMPVNLLNMAASGVSNLYPDITGGTPKTDPQLPSYQRYFVRNSMFNALTPAMSLGRKPWEMQNPELESYVKKAADWHNRYAPYIYSAVLEGWSSGYPAAMTPLHIAYSGDPATYELINRRTRQYEWMLGPSMLAAPLFGNDFDTAGTRDIYLPEGSWIDFETGERFQGPVTLVQYPIPMGKIPVFVGGAGTTVYHDSADGGYYAEIYPVARLGTEYTYTHVDGQTVSTITHDAEDWQPENVTVLEPATGSRVLCRHDPVRCCLIFPMEPGRHYVLTDRR